MAGNWIPSTAGGGTGPGWSFSGAPSTGTATDESPASTVQQATDFITTLAWVGGGAVLLYLLWPVFKEARGRERGDDYAAPTLRDSDFAETEPARVRRHSRGRRVSVEFEE